MSAPTFLQHMKFCPQLDESLCVRCGACVEVCGTGAIAEGRNKRIQAGGDLCRNCRSCVNSCNRGALTIISWFDRSGSGLSGELEDEQAPGPFKRDGRSGARLKVQKHRAPRAPTD